MESKVQIELLECLMKMLCNQYVYMSIECMVYGSYGSREGVLQYIRNKSSAARRV